MFRCLATGAALAAMFALTPPAGAEEQRAEVIHWWTSGGESAAVKVFADQFQAAGGTWVDTAIAGGANARTAAINRTVGGNPPTAMQLNTGKQFDDLVENDLLANVDALAGSQNWKAILPAAFLQAVTRNGHEYAVPVNIHGQNWLFYSTAAEQAEGRRPNSAGVQRPAELGTQPVQQCHGRTRRARSLCGLLGQTRRYDGEKP
jgi:glucose/mannose transport system substrate-binding protein